ncbi:MAG: hypothetical protein ABR880_20895 [Candidatus Sulfotelmatobacter sp.]|jgi:hypothetical protein
MQSQNFSGVLATGQTSGQVKADAAVNALVTVSGTWTGTLTLQGVDSQGNAYSISVTPTTSSTLAATITVNGAYTGSVRGFSFVQVLAGTITGSPLVTVAVG